MKLFLIRHGEIAGDPFCTPERPVSGCLSEVNGLHQAQGTADALKTASIDIAFSSSYGRALQTAETVMQYHPDAPLKVFDFLQEWQPNRDLDEVPGTEYERILEAQRDLPAEQMWQTDLGEGCYQAYARVVPPLLNELRVVGIKAEHGGFSLSEQAEKMTLAIFAHGGSLGVILAFLLGLPPFPLSRFAFELTGVAELEFFKQNDVYYPTLRIRALS